MDHRPIILTLSTLLAGLFATAQAGDPATGWWPPFVPAVPPPAVAAPAPVAGATETLVLDAYEAAGLSGFRKDWNRPIPLAADGAMTKRTDETVNFGAGPVADWDAPDKPGALEDVFPLTLREGPNPVLVKVKQVGSNWAFCLRVVDRFGNPLSGDAITSN